MEHRGCERWCALKDANAAPIRRAIGVDPIWPHDAKPERRSQDHAKNDALQVHYAIISDKESEAYMRQLDAEYAERVARERQKRFQDSRRFRK